jgi:hypothetical protein
MSSESPKLDSVRRQARRVAQHEGTARMSFGDIVTELSNRSFSFSLEGSELKYTTDHETTDSERECISANESDLIDLLRNAGWPQIRRWALFTRSLQKDPESFVTEWISQKRESGICAICGAVAESDLSYCAPCSLAGAETIDGLLKHMGTILKQVTDNPEATLKEYTPHLKAFEEGLKSFYDLFKHITTISTGSVVLIITFLEKLFTDPAWKGLVTASFGFLTLSVVASLTTMFFLSRAIAQLGKMPKRAEPFFEASMILTIASFLIGITSLVVFAIKNLYR